MGNGALVARGIAAVVGFALAAMGGMALGAAATDKVIFSSAPNLLADLSGAEARTVGAKRSGIHSVGTDKAPNSLPENGAMEYPGKEWMDRPEWFERPERPESSGGHAWQS